MYEISLSLLRLVRAHVHNFHSIEWECLYSTLENIQEHLLQLELQRDDETNVLVQVYNFCIVSKLSYISVIGYPGTF